MRGRFLAGVVGAGLVLAGLAWKISGGGDQKPAAEAKAKSSDKVKDPLPIKQVVLFNSGVGYFQREGEVEGTVHVPLAFPAGEAGLRLTHRRGANSAVLRLDGP